LRLECELTLRRLLEERSLLETWVEFLRHNVIRERLATVYQHTRQRLGDTVRRGLARGELRECEPEHVAAALTAVIEGLLLQAIADPDYDPLAAWPATWQLLSSGLVRERT
jgi:hypothetical protein